MSRLGRRSLLKAVGAASVASIASRGRAAVTKRVLKRDPLGLLDLPDGFSVRVIERIAEPMDDGYRVPGRPDAMACFRGPGGELVLMRNHENARGQSDMGALRDGQSMPPEAYDPECHGGVSRIVLDPNTLMRKSSNLVLTGTINNCAGGISPWGWLSCEEWEADADHGFVFLCDPAASKVRPPKPIKAYGRYRHEAACVDPKTMIAYLTEDQTDSAFYRFVPNDPSKPFEGKLQALAIDQLPRFDTGESMPSGELPVKWIDVDEPNPTRDMVRHHAHDQGAAFVRRGEGLWLSDDSAYFCATSGGPSQLGQVFRLDFKAEPNTLSLVAQSNDIDVLDMPDNITLAPSGHIYIAENGSGDNYVRRITPDGRVIDFARNAFSSAEFAGVCFSPDGGTMFVNLQDDGITLAVSGPFERDSARDGEMGTPLGTATTNDGGVNVGLVAGGGLAALALAAVIYRRNRRS